MLAIDSAEFPILLLQIVDQVFNSAHFQSPLLSKPKTSIAPHHSALVEFRYPFNPQAIFDQFPNDTYFGLLCQSAEVNRSLRVPSSLTYTARSRSQWNDVSRSSEMTRLG